LHENNGKKCEILDPDEIANEDFYSPDNTCAVVILKGVNGAVQVGASWKNPDANNDIMKTVNLGETCYALGGTKVRWVVIK
jgi:hypothetical protein